MPRTLKNIRITEVSSVDRGAGEGVKVLLMKRSDPKTETKMNPEIEAAIAKGIAAGIAAATAPLQATVASLQADNAILKMSADHKAYYDQLTVENLKKAFIEAPAENRAAFMAKYPIQKAAAVSDDPAVQSLAKRAETAEAESADLKKRLAVIEDRETKANFAKRAVALGLTEADGEMMRKAYSGDVAAQADLDKRISGITKSAEAIAKTAGIFSEFGQQGGGRGGATAYEEAMGKAAELRKTADGAKLSIHQAFDRVITDPANADLAKRVKDEEVAKRRAA